MNTHRTGSIRKELELLGTDVTTEVAKSSVTFSSDNTNFLCKKKQIGEIADYYRMKLTSLEQHCGSMVAKEDKDK